MENLSQIESGGHTHAHAFDSKAVKKEIWKITIYLSVLTIVELILGFIMMPWPEGSAKRDIVKGIVLALMLWKAFYIIGYFMHLRHEVRNLIMCVGIPTFLFIWFIGSFLYEGNSYKNMRIRQDPYLVEHSKTIMPVHEEEHTGSNAAYPMEKPKETNHE